MTAVRGKSDGKTVGALSTRAFCRTAESCELTCEEFFGGQACELHVVTAFVDDQQCNGGYL